MATWGSPSSRAMTSKVSEEMELTPQARPSSPSMRLTALVMPTIHTTVTGTLSQPSTQ